jgi:hypothetical protein
MKRTGMIAESIQKEQDYQENRRADWMYTKKVMRQILEDLLPQGATIYCGAGTITIRVPWGIDNLRQARQAVGSGWKFSNNYNETNGTLTKTYYRYDESVPEYSHRHRPYINLNLVMDATELNPDTCKRIEVGEKTFTQKVYQVICDGTVQEMLGKAEEMDSDTKQTV